jgi:hypothetical protein
MEKQRKNLRKINLKQFNLQRKYIDYNNRKDLQLNTNNNAIKEEEWESQLE